jgi:hypothetical protein
VRSRCQGSFEAEIASLWCEWESVGQAKSNRAAPRPLKGSETESPQKVPGHSIGRPIDLPADDPLAIGAGSLGCGLDISEISGGSVQLTPERTSSCHHPTLAPVVSKRK